MKYFNSLKYKTLVANFLAIAIVMILWFPYSAQALIQLDVNDVSYMWPPVLLKSDASRLISLSQVVPESIFQQIISFSMGEKQQGAILPTPVKMPTEVRKIQNWHIVSMRIDPCAPSSAAVDLHLEQCLQEIRFVAQPFSYDGVWNYYDFALHIIFEISDGHPKQSALFRDLLKQLLDLKTQNRAAGIDTSGIPLKIHPGFKREAFRIQLQKTLLDRLAKYKLKKVTFSGAESEEGPWVFFQGLVVNGDFQLESDPTLQHLPYGQITPELPGKGGAINPTPSNLNWPITQDNGLGPSASELFFNDHIDLEHPATVGSSTLSQVFKLKDLVHAFENPMITNRVNTDCFSCHTAMSRGMLLGVSDNPSDFKYKKPNEHVTLNAIARNENFTNFRIFGWFGSSPIVANRVIYESAQAANLIEQIFGNESNTNILN